MAGFVYLWFDRKHNRYYLGKHWGSEDDGYVCSSTWMKRAYMRRPQDFRRRILQRVDDRTALAEAERVWGLLIRADELGKRYYNLRQPGLKQWHDDPERRGTVGQKISRANTGKVPPNKGKPSPLRGRRMSDDQKVSIADTLRGRPHTEERRRNQSEAGKNRKRGCCLFCRKEMDTVKLAQWHGANCKERM